MLSKPASLNSAHETVPAIKYRFTYAFRASKKSFVFDFVFAVVMVFPFEKLSAATETNIWPLASPDGHCAISVSLNNGNLSYEVARDKKIVIQKSPLGLQRDDQDFEHSLVFDHAGKIEKRREKYELFAGTQPHVDHVLNHRSLIFSNAQRRSH